MKVYLINYDNGSRYPVMPQNLYHLQKCLEAVGHDVTIWDFNLTKRPYEDLLSLHGFPCVIGLGFISGYWPHREALKIAQVIRDHPTRNLIQFIVGGHGPSADPRYYLKKLGADAVFVGAADKSLPNRLMLAEVVPLQGVYESEGYNLEVPQYIGREESDQRALEVYKRVRFPNTKDSEFAIQILSGRGCPYSCAFCFRMGDGYKRYSIESIKKTVLYYAINNGIEHFQFSDELLMVPNFCEDVCTALMEVQEQIGKALYFDCNGRLNMAAAQPSILKLMKRAGFRYVNYGCEAMSDEVLRAMNKKQTVAEIHKGVHNTVEAGLTPGLNFMWGNPGDTEQTLVEAVNFINLWNDGSELRTIRPVTPYPGTALYNRLLEEGRCKGVDEFYDHHVNSDLFSYHFMNGIGTQQADVLIGAANRIIYTAYLEQHKKKQINASDCFYNHVSPPEQFRGFREV